MTEPKNVPWVRTRDNHDPDAPEESTPSSEWVQLGPGIMVNWRDFKHPLIEIVLKECDRLERGAQVEAKLDRRDPFFSYEDGVLTAVSCIRAKLGAIVPSLVESRPWKCGICDFVGEFGELRMHWTEVHPDELGPPHVPGDSRTIGSPLHSPQNPIPPDVYEKFHKEWSAAVGTPGYDKATWKERHLALHNEWKAKL